MSVVESDDPAVDLSVVLISSRGSAAANASLADIASTCALRPGAEVVVIVTGAGLSEGGFELIDPVTSAEVVHDAAAVPTTVRKVLGGLTASWVLVLTDDIVLEPGWLEPLLSRIADEPRLAAVSPKFPGSTVGEWGGDVALAMSRSCVIVRSEEILAPGDVQLVDTAESAVRERGATHLRTRRMLRHSALQGLRDAHRGERCVIIGNGPSLRNTPVELLRDETTFGLNRVYLAYPEWGFETTYHVVVNPYVVRQSRNDFLKLRQPLFVTDINEPLVERRTAPTFFLKKATRGFHGDVTHGIDEGYTVTYAAMQVAYYMGFSQVILVGVDHRFVTQGPANQLVQSTGDDPNHFHPGYFGKGYQWQLPDLPNSAVSYEMAKVAFQLDGRQILDATVGGALDVFEKVDLAAALG